MSFYSNSANSFFVKKYISLSQISPTNLLWNPNIGVLFSSEF
jgi:hypothetical protein